MLNNTQCDILNDAPVKRVILAFPSTKGSHAAVDALTAQLTELGIDTYRIAFPGSMDANAFALAHPPAGDSLGEAIRKATWLGKGQAPSNASAPAESIDTPASSVGSNRGPATNDTSSETKQENNTAEATVPDVPDALPARVLPAPASDLTAEIKDDDIILSIEDRRYRVRGLNKNRSVDQLKVNLLISKHDCLHVDTLDLYAAKARRHYIAQASQELGETQDTIKHDLAKVILKLEALQDQYLQQTSKPPVTEIVLSKRDKDEAMALLQAPDLIRRILHDYAQCGVVGEDTNKLIGYLAAISRKLDKPLAVIIQSTSAAGKSALMESVLAFVPEEERVQYSAVTGQSLFYMDENSLKHKMLILAEVEGASRAAYSLKILQSEGQLCIASTGKDPNSGRHVTREYKVEGQVMIFSTTTSIDIDEELLNRCLILSVDEDRTQTRAIHDYQRFEETLSGLHVSQVRDDILRVHRNAQRLLKPLKVVNPYAEQLTFLDDKTRTRRDHKKYLTLIRSIALLHQYQREVKQTYVNGKQVRYVEATLEDIALANQLAHEVLGRSLDELPPQTRRLLRLIDDMVTQYAQSVHRDRCALRFTRRDVRAYTGWGDTQLKVHLKRLEALEYLLIHRGGRGRQIVYELLYNHEGQDGRPFVMGLVDVATLTPVATQADPAGTATTQSGASRPPVGAVSPPGQPSNTPAFRLAYKALAREHTVDLKNALLRDVAQQASYPHDTVTPGQRL